VEVDGISTGFVMPGLLILGLLASPGLASRPGRLFPVKAMKAEVCARELGSGQTTRLTDTVSSFSFLNQCWKDQVIFDETTDVFRTLHFTINVRSAST
jgi:hypothetical protein